MSQSESRQLPIAWDPQPTDRLLLAATGDEIPQLSLVLSQLHATARGQVFVEVESADEVGVIEAPGRFTVTWLRRDRGQSLNRSVDAWLSEMLPTSAFDEHRVYAWIAAEGPARTLTSN